MYFEPGTAVAASVDVNLINGVLEASNVNSIEAMINMIELSKNFDLQVKMMKTLDENSGVSARLMQMS